MHTNKESHMKLITIGSNGLYGRRKRSDLYPSDVKALENIFFCIFFKRMKSFM